MTRIVVIDFETTGMTKEDAPVEIGWRALEDGRVLNTPAIADAGALLMNPGRPIPAPAMAVHHITDHMVADAAPVDAVLDFVLGDLADGAILAAHNAAFDRMFAGPYAEREWICTMKVARRVWPDAPSHGNQSLRYSQGIRLDERGYRPPHRAGPDAYLTAGILEKLLEHATVEEMLIWSGQPSILRKMPFGKHAEKPFSEMPQSYLEWIVAQDGIDPDVKFTAQRWLTGGGA